MPETAIMVLYDDKYLSITKHSQAATLEYTFKGFVPSQHYRTVMLQVLESLQQFGYTKLLANLTHLEAIASSDAQWFITEFLPRARQAGLQHEAVVVPTTDFGVASIVRMSQKLQKALHGVQRINFNSRETALVWLETAA